MLLLYVGILGLCFFFFKQKTAYEMRISDWSSDVCSSDLLLQGSECRAESFVDFHINALAVWLRILRRCGGDAGWLQPGRLFLRSGFARFFCCDSLSNQLPPMRHSALKAVNQFRDAEMRKIGRAHV